MATKTTDTATGDDSNITPVDDSNITTEGGRRRRSKGYRKNTWLSHVKTTMKFNRGKSFKQVLKLAAKSYKKSKSKSQSQSQSAGRRKKKTHGGSSMKQSIDALLQKQQGGSGIGKVPLVDTAASV